MHLIMRTATLIVKCFFIVMINHPIFIIFALSSSVDNRNLR